MKQSWKSIQNWKSLCLQRFIAERGLSLEEIMKMLCRPEFFPKFFKKNFSSNFSKKQKMRCFVVLLCSTNSADSLEEFSDFNIPLPHFVNLWTTLYPNFMWLDSHSCLQTNNSKWFNISFDSTRLNHDSIWKKFRWLWLEGLLTLTRPVWLEHIT